MGRRRLVAHTLAISHRPTHYESASLVCQTISYELHRIQHCRRPYISQASADTSCVAPSSSSNTAGNLLGQRAKQKQADKEFFANLLSSAATRRDAKAYLARLKVSKKLMVHSEITDKGKAIPTVNLGSLFATPRAIDASPKFTQHRLDDDIKEGSERLHIALVKIQDVSSLTDSIISGVARTLSQLAALGMIPCVVVDVSTSSLPRTKQRLVADADKLAAAFESSGEHGANVIDNAYNISSHDEISVTMKGYLLRSLRAGRIAIVTPVAYAESDQALRPILPNDAMVALAKAFIELTTPGAISGQQATPVEKSTTRVQVSLDRIILIDQAGGISNAASTDGRHVFVNLAQEHDLVTEQLSQSLDCNTSLLQHSNLDLLNQLLQILPQSSSGLMTTPDDVANLAHADSPTSAPTVGTRRQKNMLVYNLLTDKPVISSSLPTSRLHKATSTNLHLNIPTFVKFGMPVTILPDPIRHCWTPRSSRLRLTDSAIDLDKLVYLINDSFNRELDMVAYLDRVNENIAGVIIAGDYEGGAILTWEAPPGMESSDKSRLVPYLDKFAVLKRSQGSGGVADIVFNAMVRSCFPSGVCWRSRKDNPVNKWYFERSKGTWKIPDTNWTMFWTTPNVVQDAQPFSDYERVCRGVMPTWRDKVNVED